MKLDKILKHSFPFIVATMILAGCGDQDPIEEDEPTDDVIEETEDIENIEGDRLEGDGSTEN